MRRPAGRSKFRSLIMGSSTSRESPSERAAREVCAWLSPNAVPPPESMRTAMATLLGEGLCTQLATEEIDRQGATRRHPNATASMEELPVGLGEACLALDPQLALARFRRVPSRTSEAYWWHTYLSCLRRSACSLLPLLMLRATADEPVRAEDDLAAAALSLAARSIRDAPDLLSLGRASRRLYASCGHSSRAWESLLAQDFPADCESGGGPGGGARAHYIAIATGRVAPAARVRGAILSAVDECLARTYDGESGCGDDADGDTSMSSSSRKHRRYGGWGSPHLEVAFLRRTPTTCIVRASFEFKYDDGEVVWGGRASENIWLRRLATTTSGNGSGSGPARGGSPSTAGGSWVGSIMT